jgi:ferrous iron transport protein B
LDALIGKGGSDGEGTVAETFLVALAGQPNVGKTTVFNLLTGLNQHVGNWPGKTIEKKAGEYHHNGLIFQIVDLPGTYSLTANSPEEVIARDFIIKERPDVVVAVIGAEAPERNLYLISELLPLPSRVVVGVNMMDVAEREGIQIETDVLQAAIGVPVVPMVATRNWGVRELMDAVEEVANGHFEYAPRTPQIREDHRAVLDELQALIEPAVPEPYPVRWTALKLLEGDREMTHLVRERLSDEDWQQVHAILLAHEDAVVAIASGRYDWIGRMTRAALARPRTGRVTLTERLDRIATHPVWGLGLLVLVLALVFGLTYSIGTPLQDVLDRHLVAPLADWLTASLSGGPSWLTGLLVDGVLAGAGTVITFFPILVTFFACMGLLEDLGYMARAAYVTDRFMHLMGLHGRSFLPLFLGFGCNVPSVIGTRIIDTPRARLLTILLSPLVPCTGRMVVIAFLAPIFFRSTATLVSGGLILTSLIVLALVGIIINRLLFKGEHLAFIMELPLYHIPHWRTIGLLVWQRTLEFVTKAGTIILVMSVILWALSSYPGETIEESALAAVGRWLEPVGRLMGLGWKMMLALLSGFFAKENAIATLGILYGAAESKSGLAETLSASVGPAAGLSFMVVQMLFVPCVATVAAIRQETRSWRWTAFSVALLSALSFIGGTVVYQVAALLGWA